MHLTVFVHTLMNEFMSLVFDYWSDPNMEIATYIHSAMVDGVVTDFPAKLQICLGHLNIEIERHINMTM